ncbi:MAG: hypothetical protein QG608_1510 [Actinomycetota bacterium]|nr:hypothetical protein [Actinomycetota bacterium]
MKKSRKVSVFALSAILWAMSPAAIATAQTAATPDKPLRVRIERFGHLLGDGSVETTFQYTCPLGTAALGVRLRQAVSGIVVSGEEHVYVPCNGREQTRVLQTSVWQWGSNLLGKHFGVGEALAEYRIEWCADPTIGECSGGTDRSETIFVRH